MTRWGSIATLANRRLASPNLLGRMGNGSWKRQMPRLDFTAHGVLRPSLISWQLVHLITELWLLWTSPAKVIWLDRNGYWHLLERQFPRCGRYKMSRMILARTIQKASMDPPRGFVLLPESGLAAASTEVAQMEMGTLTLRSFREARMRLDQSSRSNLKIGRTCIDSKMASLG